MPAGNGDAEPRPVEPRQVSVGHIAVKSTPGRIRTCVDQIRSLVPDPLGHGGKSQHRAACVHYSWDGSIRKGGELSDAGHRFPSLPTPQA